MCNLVPVPYLKKIIYVMFEKQDIEDFTIILIQRDSKTIRNLILQWKKVCVIRLEPSHSFYLF